MIWTAVVGFLSIVGGLCVYFYLIPNLDVQPVLGLPKGHIFPNAFSLKNNGYLTVYPKEVRFVIRDGIDTNQNAFHNRGAGSKFVSEIMSYR